MAHLRVRVVESTSRNPWLDITATEWSWWFTPRLRASLEVGLGGLKSFEAIASGDIFLANAFSIHILAIGLSTETTLFDLPPSLEMKHVVYLGQLGPVPVFALFDFDFKIKSKAEAQVLFDLSCAYRQDLSASFGITYNQTSGIGWINDFQATSPDFGARLVPSPASSRSH